MSVRELFVARFGEGQAMAIEDAASGHVTDDHREDNRGSDPFKYDLLLCVAYECLGAYASNHGITPPEEELRAWALEEGDLASHDGDVPDYLSLLAGAYVPWVVKEKELSDD